MLRLEHFSWRWGTRVDRCACHTELQCTAAAVLLVHGVLLVCGLVILVAVGNDSACSTVSAKALSPLAFSGVSCAFLGFGFAGMNLLALHACPKDGEAAHVASSMRIFLLLPHIFLFCTIGVLVLTLWQYSASLLEECSDVGPCIFAGALLLWYLGAIVYPFFLQPRQRGGSSKVSVVDVEAQPGDDEFAITFKDAANSCGAAKAFSDDGRSCGGPSPPLTSVVPKPSPPSEVSVTSAGLEEEGAGRHDVYTSESVESMLVVPPPSPPEPRPIRKAPGAYTTFGGTSPTRLEPPVLPSPVTATISDVSDLPSGSSSLCTSRASTKAPSTDVKLFASGYGAGSSCCSGCSRFVAGDHQAHSIGSGTFASDPAIARPALQLCMAPRRKSRGKSPSGLPTEEARDPAGSEVPQEAPPTSHFEAAAEGPGERSRSPWQRVRISMSDPTVVELPHAESTSPDGSATDAVLPGVPSVSSKHEEEPDSDEEDDQHRPLRSCLKARSDSGSHVGSEKAQVSPPSETRDRGAGGRRKATIFEAGFKAPLLQDNPINFSALAVASASSSSSSNSDEDAPGVWGDEEDGTPFRGPRSSIMRTLLQNRVEDTKAKQPVDFGDSSVVFNPVTASRASRSSTAAPSALSANSLAVTTSAAELPSAISSGSSSAGEAEGLQLEQDEEIWNGSEIEIPVWLLDKLKASGWRAPKDSTVILRGRRAPQDQKVAGAPFARLSQELRQNHRPLGETTVRKRSASFCSTITDGKSHVSESMRTAALLEKSTRRRLTLMLPEMTTQEKEDGGREVPRCGPLPKASPRMARRVTLGTLQTKSYKPDRGEPDRGAADGSVAFRKIPMPTRCSSVNRSFSRAFSPVGAHEADPDPGSASSDAVPRASEPAVRVRQNSVILSESVMKEMLSSAIDADRMIRGGDEAGIDAIVVLPLFQPGDRFIGRHCNCKMDPSTGKVVHTCMTPAATEANNTAFQSFVNSAWMTRLQTKANTSVHSRRASLLEIDASEEDESSPPSSTHKEPDPVKKRIRNASILIASVEGPSPGKQNTDAGEEEGELTTIGESDDETEGALNDTNELTVTFDASMHLTVDEAEHALYNRFDFVGPEELAKMMRDKNARDHILVVDVRGRDWIGGHIPMSINVRTSEVLKRPGALVDQCFRSGVHHVIFTCMYSVLRARKCMCAFQKQQSVMYKQLKVRCSVLAGGFHGWVNHFWGRPGMVNDFDPNSWATCDPMQGGLVHVMDALSSTGGQRALSEALSVELAALSQNRRGSHSSNGSTAEDTRGGPGNGGAVAEDPRGGEAGSGNPIREALANEFHRLGSGEYRMGSKGTTGSEPGHQQPQQRAHGAPGKHADNDRGCSLAESFP